MQAMCGATQRLCGDPPCLVDDSALSNGRHGSGRASDADPMVLIDRLLVRRLTNWIV